MDYIIEDRRNESVASNISSASIIVRMFGRMRTLHGLLNAGSPPTAGTISPVLQVLIAQSSLADCRVPTERAAVGGTILLMGILAEVAEGLPSTFWSIVPSEAFEGHTMMTHAVDLLVDPYVYDRNTRLIANPDDIQYEEGADLSEEEKAHEVRRMELENAYAVPQLDDFVELCRRYADRYPFHLIPDFEVDDPIVDMVAIELGMHVGPGDRSVVREYVEALLK